MDDIDAWKLCHPDDLWLFDKLILSRKLGYTCGPKGMSVPKPGHYIIRPITNVLGMGRGASIVYLENSTDVLPDGTFWCEIFEGRHISTDYHKGNISLVVEGLRSTKDLSCWDKWVKINDVKLEFPDIEIKGNYNWINIETIGDKIIEIHLRRNPDFIGHDANHIIPVYEEGKKLDGYKFIANYDYNRKGFFIPI